MFKDRDEALQRMEQALLEEEELDREEETWDEDEDWEDEDWDEDEDWEDEALPQRPRGSLNPRRAYNSDLSDEDLDSYSAQVADGTRPRGCLPGPLVAVLLLALALAGAAWYAFGGMEVWP